MIPTYIGKHQAVSSVWNRLWNESIGAAIPPPSHADWLRFSMATFGLWLLAMTHPLWLTWGQFPQVPWFSWGCHVPRHVDFCLLVIVGVTLAGIGTTAPGSRWNQISLLSFAVAWLGLLLLDQHRCQPWAYQWLLIALVLAWAPHHRLSVTLLRVLVIGVYVHSAISKCDVSFCQGLGRQFVATLTNTVPANVRGDWWPLLFPLGEFVVALGLVWPRTRRTALWLATVMHVVLLYVLGPWGLRHSGGVLVWNLFFIAQNWLLFGGSRVAAATPAESVSNRLSFSNRAAIALTVGVTLWPLFEPWGYCDLWPAWGLYAQHGEHIQIRMTRVAVRRLPVMWSQTINDEAGSNWCSIPAQRVSLQQTFAPVYPQNRYLFGVVLALARDAQIPSDEVSATWISPANRVTGKVQTRELRNLHEIEAMADKCWFNARPRQ